MAHLMQLIPMLGHNLDAQVLGGPSGAGPSVGGNLVVPQLFSKPQDAPTVLVPDAPTVLVPDAPTVLVPDAAKKDYRGRQATMYRVQDTRTGASFVSTQSEMAAKLGVSVGTISRAITTGILYRNNYIFNDSFSIHAEKDKEVSVAPYTEDANSAEIIDTGKKRKRYRIPKILLCQYPNGDLCIFKSPEEASAFLEVMPNTIRTAISRGNKTANCRLSVIDDSRVKELIKQGVSFRSSKQSVPLHTATDVRPSTPDITIQTADPVLTGHPAGAYCKVAEVVGAFRPVNVPALFMRSQREANESIRAPIAVKPATDLGKCTASPAVDPLERMEKQRKLLQGFKDMQNDGLITQANYDCIAEKIIQDSY
jgi:hypothetical protein